MKKKVLFCIDKFGHRGGASKALSDLINNNNEYIDPIVVCIIHHTKDIKENFKIIEGDAKLIIDTFYRDNYEIIHYFKADGRMLLLGIGEIIRKKHLNIPVITTVCQKPSFNPFQLSPKEIAFSNKLVFIDKAAYNDSLYTFIPTDRKTVIYCGSPQSTIDFTGDLADKYQENHEIPIIGRASLLSKCPLDTFDVFDKISNPKKIVILGGGPMYDTFVKEASKHTSYKTELKGNLKYEDYLTEMSKFDIFLYYLPQTAHSSIDFTLGEAMLLKKPCVYYGPAAPAERFVNGVNGFIANSKDELVSICNNLLKDRELSCVVGEKARESTIRDFSIAATVCRYKTLYEEILNTKDNNVNIPNSYKCYYAVNSTRVFIIKAINKVFRLTHVNYQIKMN